jgi:hypothetical protein
MIPFSPLPKHFYPIYHGSNIQGNHVLIFVKMVIKMNKYTKVEESDTMKENNVTTLLAGIAGSTLLATAIFFLVKPFMLSAISSTLIELLLRVR